MSPMIGPKVMGANGSGEWCRICFASTWGGLKGNECCC